MIAYSYDHMSLICNDNVRFPTDHDNLFKYKKAKRNGFMVKMLVIPFASYKWMALTSELPIPMEYNI